MPRWLLYLVVVVVVLSWLPLAVIMRARHTTSTKPRIHIVQDMDNQPKIKAQARNRLFADRRGMRPPVPGTVVRGELREDDGLYRGMTGEDWVEAIPIPVTLQLATGWSRNGPKNSRRARGHHPPLSTPSWCVAAETATSSTVSPTVSGTCLPTRRRSRCGTGGQSSRTYGPCNGARGRLSRMFRLTCGRS